MEAKAEDVDAIDLKVGEKLDLESLRAAVTPSQLMLIPFVEPPEGIEVEGQDGLGEDGVHGSVFHLAARESGEGQLVVGFKDLRTSEVTHRKAIQVAVHDPGT
jgi:hypothetical protein